MFWIRSRSGIKFAIYPNPNWVSPSWLAVYKHVFLGYRLEVLKGIGYLRLNVGRMPVLGIFVRKVLRCVTVNHELGELRLLGIESDTVTSFLGNLIHSPARDLAADPSSCGNKVFTPSVLLGLQKSSCEPCLGVFCRWYPICQCNTQVEGNLDQALPGIWGVNRSYPP